MQIYASAISFWDSFNIAICVFCIRYAGEIVVDLACENCHHRVKNHCTGGGRKENLNRKEESNRKEGAS